ncbi:MAG: hypothetical protein PVF58_18455 [Candidatus Methanofastidiosia archaeon]
MSVIALTTNAKTGGKIPYIKESILLARNLPTKIILKFIVNFKKEGYQRLLAEGIPTLTILTTLRVKENSPELLSHRLVQAGLTKQVTLLYECKTRSLED